ncbi:MAG TPA: glycosyltransferase [Gemmatimonadaceae bacterium]|nr:glycosyltransferase [Gemmatimonadaceae bacterium]
MFRASVVIPTYRRRASLLRALGALATQRIPPSEYEVVVVVDGSDDGTREAAAAAAMPYALRVLWQKNRGRAAACNAGIAVARGNLVVVLDDDMTATPELLAAHLAAHERPEPVAVIGAAPVPMTADMPAPARYVGTKFNRHLERLAEAGGPLALREFYGGNLSVRRGVLEEVGAFDERFTVYGNEDLELSIRLQEVGVRIVYEPAAVAYQSYDKDFAALARDHESKGRTAVVLAEKHPSVRSALKLGASGSDPLVRRLALAGLLRASRAVPSLRERLVRFVARLGERRPALALPLYPLVLDFSYWCGVRAATRERRETAR